MWVPWNNEDWIPMELLERYIRGFILYDFKSASKAA